MSLYDVDTNGKIAEYSRIDMPKEKGIEDFLHKHPEVIEKGIMIVGRQVQAGNMGRIDLLGMDRTGAIIVIEVKKGAASRDVVSQILHYAVWAKDIKYDDLNKAYNDLNKKEEKSDVHTRLYDEVKTRFKGWVPQKFNSSQRLYIVGEEIDQKTADICTYLNQGGIQISCIKMGFFDDGKDGHDDKVNIRAVHVDTVTENQEGGEFNKWTYNMKHAKTDSPGTINDIISYIKTALGCTGSISKSAATCTFYTGGKGSHGTRFAVIYAYKTVNSAFDFRCDPPDHDFPDDRVTPANWTFGDAGRTIEIIPENKQLIIDCVKHAYDAAKRADTNNR